MRRTRLVRLLAAPAGRTAEGPIHPATSAAMLLEGSTVRCPWLLHAGPYLGRRSSTLTVMRTLRTRPQDGAQAAYRRRAPCNQTAVADTQQQQQTPRSAARSKHRRWSGDGDAC